MLCCAVLCAALCCAVLCCAVLCWAGLCCAALCCAALRCAALCCRIAVLCCAVLRCAVLCCRCVRLSLRSTAALPYLQQLRARAACDDIRRVDPTIVNDRVAIVDNTGAGPACCLGRHVPIRRERRGLRKDSRPVHDRRAKRRHLAERGRPARPELGVHAERSTVRDRFPQGHAHKALRKTTPLFLSVALCSSQACLGKSIGFDRFNQIYKWRAENGGKVAFSVPCPPSDRFLRRVRRDRSRHRSCTARGACRLSLRKNDAFVEFSLCLSCACLGKMSVLCIDGAKSGVFRTSQKIGTAIRIRAEVKVDDASQVPANARASSSRQAQRDTWFKCEAVSDKH